MGQWMGAATGAAHGQWVSKDLPPTSLRPLSDPLPLGSSLRPHKAPDSTALFRWEHKPGGQ